MNDKDDAREILSRAVNWWLDEGHMWQDGNEKVNFGAPEWVFAARKLLEDDE